jgi:hypothetical protein
MRQHLRDAHKLDKVSCVLFIKCTSCLLQDVVTRVIEEEQSLGPRLKAGAMSVHKNDTILNGQHAGDASM